MNVYSALLSSGYHWQVPVIAIYWPSFPSIGESDPRSSIQGRTLQCHVNCNVRFYSFSTWPPKSNKIKMSRARVKYICQNAIHLISHFGCVEFGNLMLFIVWPLVPAYTGKGTGSAGLYSGMCWGRSWLFAVWLKNTLLRLRTEMFFHHHNCPDSLLEMIYSSSYGGQGEENFSDGKTLLPPPPALWDPAALVSDLWGWLQSGRIGPCTLQSFSGVTLDYFFPWVKVAIFFT